MALQTRIFCLILFQNQMAMDILIKYEDTDLSDCVDRTRRIVGGVFMAVTAGRAS